MEFIVMDGHAWTICSIHPDPYRVPIPGVALDGVFGKEGTSSFVSYCIPLFAPSCRHVLVAYIMRRTLCLYLFFNLVV